jgi:transcriptional regulator with XRE-family HTH domain
MAQAGNPSNGFGHALSTARTAKQWSQSALAARMFVSRTLIAMWETGRRLPSVEQVTHLDQLLGADGVLCDVAIGDAGGSIDTGWNDCVRTTLALWDHDAGRRQLLYGAVYAIAAATTGAALSTRSAPTGTGNRRVGAAEIEAIRAVTAAYRGLDNRFGGGAVRTGLLRYLHGEAGPLLKHGSYSPATGRQLAAAVGEANLLLAWMCYDTDLHGAAQKYFTRARQLAAYAEDPLLSTEILAAQSHQAAYLGHGPTAAGIAETAQAVATRHGATALAAEATVMAAHGHALAGHRRTCARLLLEAEQQLDSTTPDDNPQWLSYFDAAYLAAKAGHCLHAAGDQAAAVDAARRSLDMVPGYTRGQMFNHALLATALADAGDVEEACAQGTAAITMATELRSHRAIEYVRRLDARLAAYPDAPGVPQLHAAAQRLQQQRLQPDDGR